MERKVVLLSMLNDVQVRHSRQIGHLLLQSAVVSMKRLELNEKQESDIRLAIPATSFRV